MGYLDLTPISQTTGTKKYEEQESGSESVTERMARQRDEHTASMKAAYEKLYAKIATSALPALKGSPKQITWAESIRTTAAARIRRMYRAYDQLPDRAVEKVSEKDLEEMRKHATHLVQTDASWWISNRSRWGA